MAIAQQIDLTKLNQTLESLEKTRERRKLKPASTTPKSEVLFYDLLARLYRQMRTSSEEGEPFVGFGMGVLNEIFVAMDLPSIQIDTIGIWLVAYSDSFDEVFNAAYEVGLKTEICSPHLVFTGLAAKKWLPAPVAIVSNSLQQCDNCSHSQNIPAKIYGVPTFLICRTYRWWSERGVTFMAGELQELIEFLENLTHRKMDMDRLREAIRVSQRQIELIRQIHDLVMATPCPANSRTLTSVHWVRRYYGGRPEGVLFFETLRDELKALVEQGKGAVTPERFRLLSGYTPPLLRAMDWLEERGAAIVAEPYYLRFPEWEVDLSKPLEALARLYYVEPYCRFYGPMEQHVEMLVSDAIESKADACIYWFNSKCRMGGCAYRVVKETLREKAGIPTLIVDVDILDPSPFSVFKLLQTELGRFLQVLETAKAGKGET